MALHLRDNLIVYMGGGILDVSIISFQTILSAKSADVVGKSLMELILYNPIASHTRLMATKISLGTCVSVSRLPKVDSILKMLVIGVKIAMLVVEMEKRFSDLPDMYIMNAFMRIC